MIIVLVSVVVLCVVLLVVLVCCGVLWLMLFFFFKQKTAYEMRISDWSSDVCSSDLCRAVVDPCAGGDRRRVAAERQRRCPLSGQSQPAAAGGGRRAADLGRAGCCLFGRFGLRERIGPSQPCAVGAGPFR